MILTRLLAFLLRFCQKISTILFSLDRGSDFKNKASGYVLMLFIVTLPILLFGTKYVLDYMSASQVKIEESKGTVTYYKICAKEAALAVAKNWNPGLNLSYQKNALMKIADAVYNDNPCYIMNNSGTTGIIGTAIPGLDEKKAARSSQTGSKFNPLKIIYQQVVTHSSIMSAKEIKYNNVTKYLLRYYRGYYTSNYSGAGGVYGNTLFRMWRETDLNTAPSYRYSNFDEINETERGNHNYVLKHHDIYGLPCMGWQGHFTSYPYYPTNGYFWPGCSNYHSTWVMTIPSTSSSVSQYYPWKYHSSSSTSGNISSTTTTYKTRITPSGTDPVTIAVDSDRIKVTTDSNTGYRGTIGYAQPAQCNVDIVLAIPVNGAACHTSNNDAASSTAGAPMDTQEYSQSSTYPTQATPTFSSTVTGTPLYQMGQACKNFVKDNFYHIKGVTVGLIPYSAKVSISPDKASRYTIAIPRFVEYTPWTNPYYPTAAMYGTSGEKDAPLVQGYKTTAIGSGQTLPTTDTPYYWGGMLTGCPIMCRRGSTTTWYNTQLAYGNLLSNASPSNGDQYKYMRMNLNPCLAGYANQLSMKCERKCTHFFPNPYYMIEPTSDMVKIYEMCNALFPIYDPNNVSNFLFIPFEWANNFWQSWTTDVTASASTDTLSRPSKTTSGRKKALVMLVNKPDWFEPGEMTYLGFDNDYSSVPLAESDKIDFSINYSDTSKKFLDGTNYNGTPRGPKKIIRYATQSGTISRNSTTGAFECTGSGTGRLYFPRKAMVRLTVKHIGGGGGFSENPDWKYYANALNSSGTSYTSYWGCYQNSYGSYDRGDNLITYGNGVFVCLNYVNNVSAYSYDGVTWYRGGAPGATYWCGLAWNGSYFVAITRGKYVSYSSDGINWSYYGTASGTLSTCLCQGGGLVWDSQNSRFYIVNDSGYAFTTTSNTDTSGWSQLASSGCRYSSTETTAYGNGYYVQYYSGNVRYSTNGTSWTTVGTLPQSKYGCMTFGGGKFYIICTDGTIIYASNPTSTSNWTYLDGSGASTSSLYNKSGRSDWTSIRYGNGKLVAVSNNGSIAVLEDNSTPGTIQFTNIGDTTTFTIRDEKTFTIPAAKISSTSGGEYYVEFNVSNLQLISAEVTNLSYTYVNPINTSYNEVEMIGPSDSSANLSWGTRSVAIPDRYIYQTSGQSSCSSDSNFNMAKNGLTSYDSTYGWYPSSKDSQKSVTIYSNTNQPVTLYGYTYTPNAISGSESITFYSDNGVVDNVGTHSVSSSGTTFTFSGPLAFLSTQSNNELAHGYGTSRGVNFQRNLSVKKVRYLTSYAKITSCRLSNQVLRFYGGQYTDGYGSPGKPQPLILNNGSSESRSGYLTSSSGPDPYPYHKDSCVQFQSGVDYHCCHPGITNYTVDIYGATTPTNFVNGYCAGATFYYYCSCCSGAVNIGTYPRQHYANIDLTGHCGAYYSDRSRFQASGGTYSSMWFLVKNSSSKSLYSTSPTNANPYSIDNLTYNKYIYLVDYSGERWICFQGDGQLEVTVQPTGESYNTPYVKIPSNTSGSYNTYNLSTSHGSSYSYTVPSSAFSWDEANQRYYTTYPIYLYNASLRYAYQPGTTINYPVLKANSSYSVTYSYNDYNGNRQVTTGSTSNYDSSEGKYYLNLPRNVTPKFAARKYSVTESVYDMIDFSSNSIGNKNGCLSSSFSDNYGSGFYYVGSSSVTRTLSTSRKGRLELKVAPSFYADSGYIKMNYGSDTSAKTITAPTTLSMKYSDLSSGTMQFTLYNCVILYAKLHDAEAVISSPNSGNARTLMWNTSAPSASNISLSGSYSNWYADEGWHKLTNSSFLTWNNSYVSDITATLDTKSPIFAYWFMPEYYYNDSVTNFVGPVRLFSQIRRSSARKYCQMYAYNSSYSNKANLLWHHFTLPLNHVLYRAGYQSAGGDATAATRSATAAVCAKLKSDYGSNLRVYIVKYRKQTQYKTFPNYNVSQTNADHTYSTIDACATSSSYVYDVSNETDLKTTLNAIANNIKSFAGGVTAARNVD